MPTTPSNIWAIMARVYAAGLELAHAGTVSVRRYANTRAQPWRDPASSLYSDFPQVAYAGGPVAKIIDGVNFIERKFLISAPHTTLTEISALTDTIVCDGVEYPIEDVKPVPRAGPHRAFWNVMTRLGRE